VYKAWLCWWATNVIVLKSKLKSRSVTINEIQAFCKINSLEYFEVSAKSRTNVTAVFMSGAEKVIEQINCGVIDPYQEVCSKVGNQNGSDQFSREKTKQQF
jgi:hypothetical protein